MLNDLQTAKLLLASMIYGSICGPQPVATVKIEHAGITTILQTCVQKFKYTNGQITIEYHDTVFKGGFER